MGDNLNWLLRPLLWQSLLIVGGFVVLVLLWRACKPEPERMDFKDWCLLSCSTGAVALVVGGFGDWPALVLAGGLLWAPMYVIAFGALIFRLDETARDIARFWRR